MGANSKIVYLTRRPHLALEEIADVAPPTDIRRARRLGYSTNDLLAYYGLQGSERTNLFLAYGAANARQALEVLSKRSSKTNTQLLVATVDLIARKGDELTRRLFDEGIDVVAAVRGHYKQNPLSTQEPTDGTQIEQRVHAAKSYLIKKYILGLDVQLPAPLKIAVGGGQYTNPIVRLA